MVVKVLNIKNGSQELTISGIKDIRDAHVHKTPFTMNCFSKLRVKVTSGAKVRVEIFHTQQTLEVEVVYDNNGAALGVESRGDGGMMQQVNDGVTPKICKQEGHGAKEEEQGGDKKHLELKSNEVIKDVVESEEYKGLKNFGGEKRFEMVKDVVKSKEKPHGFCEQKGKGAEEHNQGVKELYTKSKSIEVLNDVAESEECKGLKIFGDEERSKIDMDLGESEDCKVLNSLGGKVGLEAEDILGSGSVVDMYEEVQVPFVKREVSGNVVSPDKTLMVTSFFLKKKRA